jgi:hypothetical protein
MHVSERESAQTQRRHTDAFAFSGALSAPVRGVPFSAAGA